MSLLVTTTITESSSQVATIKLCQGALVEAADPHGRIPTSPSKHYKLVMLENIAMLWMGIGEIHHHVTTGNHNHH